MQFTAPGQSLAYAYIIANVLPPCRIMASFVVTFQVAPRLTASRKLRTLLRYAHEAPSSTSATAAVGSTSLHAKTSVLCLKDEACWRFLRNNQCNGQVQSADMHTGQRCLEDPDHCCCSVQLRRQVSFPPPKNLFPSSYFFHS